jgi:uncharacterized protein YkwD
MICLSGCAKTLEPDENGSPEEIEVIRLVNEERAKAGIAPLEMDPSLMRSCDIRADELTVKFSHDRPNGESCFSVIEFASQAAGENIAYGQPDAKSVMDTWMKSTGHQNNILNPNFTHIGVGYISKNNTAYWVQLFVKK